MSIPWTRDIKFGVKEDSSIRLHIFITQAVVDPNVEEITSVSIGCPNFKSVTKTIDLRLTEAGYSGSIEGAFNSLGIANVTPKAIMDAFGDNKPMSQYAGYTLTAASDEYSAKRVIPYSGSIGLILLKK